MKLNQRPEYAILRFMVAMWRVREGELLPIERVRLDNEQRLEVWLERDPALLGLDILIIGRQVTTDHGGRIDLLGIDRSGDLVVLELKRDRTSREIVSQILDYASWVTTLTPKRVHELADSYLPKRLSAAFMERFSEPIPENLNTAHRMVIIASDLDEASRRIVEYLSTEHDIGINTFFFNVFRHGDDELVVADWLMDEQEVEERSAARRRPPWTGFWYVNVTDNDGDRSWDDQREFGFITAGGGPKYSRPLQHLKVGDPLFAYLKGCGYVGHGIVRSEATLVSRAEIRGKKLADPPLKLPDITKRDDPEKGEYVVGVDWTRTVEPSDAKKFKGVFANQNVVCRLRDEATIEFLQREFDVRAADTTPR